MSETTKEERTRYKTIQLGIAANCEPMSPEKVVPPGCGMTCGFLLRLIADADRLAELESDE